MLYTISEAAAIMNLNAPTLRYYDKEGLLPFVDRSESGIRVFKSSDLEWLSLIECLKSTGMSIKDIKKFIDWYMEGDSTLLVRRDMFLERKVAVEKQLEKAKKMLEIVNYKCWFYEEAVKAGSVEKVKNMPSSEIPKKVIAGRMNLIEKVIEK